MLQDLFPDINDVDLYVGGLAEDRIGASIVGPLYQRILQDDFTRLRDGDRFWFENNQFSQAEVREIMDTRLSDVLRRNSALTDIDIPDNSFFLDTRYTEFHLQRDFPTRDGFPDTRGHVFENEQVIFDSKYKLLWRADHDRVHFMLQVHTE